MSGRKRCHPVLTHTQMRYWRASSNYSKIYNMAGEMQCRHISPDLSDIQQARDGACGIRVGGWVGGSAEHLRYLGPSLQARLFKYALWADR